MSKRLDELAKDLAGGMSRRKALWRFFAGAGVAVIAGRKAKAEGNNICVDFCQAFGSPTRGPASGRDFGQCMAASAQCPPGECAVLMNGTTYVCGPIVEPPI